jgi:hypothetical protein
MEEAEVDREGSGHLRSENDQEVSLGKGRLGEGREGGRTLAPVEGQRQDERRVCGSATATPRTGPPPPRGKEGGRTEGAVEVKRVGIAAMVSASTMTRRRQEGQQSTFDQKPKARQRKASNVPVDLEEPAGQVASLPHAPDAVEVGMVEVEERVAGAAEDVVHLATDAAVAPVGGRAGGRGRKGGSADGCKGGGR